MTRDEIARTLADLARHLDARVEVWRVLITPDGREQQRIYRGAFVARLDAPDWRTAQPVTPKDPSDDD